MPSLVDRIIPEWAGGVAFKRGKEKEKTQHDRDQVRVCSLDFEPVWFGSAAANRACECGLSAGRCQISVLASFLKIQCALLPEPLTYRWVYGLENCSGEQLRMRSRFNWRFAKKKREITAKMLHKIFAFQAGLIN